MKYSKLRCFAWLVRDDKDDHVTNITNRCRNSSWVACDDFNMVGFTFLVMGKSVASRDTLWNSFPGFSKFWGAGRNVVDSDFTFTERL